MANQTQIDRLRAVRSYLKTNFKHEIHANQIAEVACYSYRNINRIFRAVYGESIGASIQRLQLEGLAKQVLYTERTITEIAYEAGYNDLQAFNKSFKSIYGASPMQFRKENRTKEQGWLKSNQTKMERETKNLQYRLETLSDLEVLYLPYHGPYEVSAIMQSWEVLWEYANKEKLIGAETLYFGEILDDEDITQPEMCRYNCAITLPANADHQPKGFLQLKTIPEQKYAVFTHQGSYESTEQTYELIYGHWLLEQAFDLVDKPVLELYHNDESITPAEDLLTDIYVPIK